MRIATRILLTLILGVMLASMAAAQGNKPIGQVEIVVKDLSTKQDIAVVQPGGTVELPAGARVRLIMTALPTGSARGPMYPATTISDTAKGGVTITRSNAENSTADLVLNNAKNAGRIENIRFQITDTSVPANLRTGTFSIRVTPASEAGGTSTGGASTGTLGSSRAEQLTRLLYQAILLRDLDSGAQGTIDSIQRGGYDSLVQAAVGIANSDESRRLAATPSAERLASLYKVLLGVTPEQADAGQWSADLDLMNRGRLGDVVAGIVRSDRFRERHNVGSVRY